MRRQHAAAAVTLLVTSMLGAASHAQDVTEPESFLRLHYSKREVQIPMRDGVKLFTAIYAPRDTTRNAPFLMIRTPYGVKPYGAHEFPKSLGPSFHFAREGYIFVYQDVRGRHMSEGKFVQVTPHLVDKKSRNQTDESSDTFDTIEWLLTNVPHHNGRVGQWGISYPGFYCSAGMIDAHPALKAVSPQAPVGDWFFDDFFHHGAFFLAHGFRWLSGNGNHRDKPTTNEYKPFEYPTRDGYQFFLDIGAVHQVDEKLFKKKVDFWSDLMQHPNYDDFWQRRNILPHLKRVAPAVMTVGGWYDAEDLYGTFETYRHLERQNPGVKNTLVVGPWVHGGWARGDGDHLGAIAFGSKTAEFYRRHIELPFFNRHLKDSDDPAPPEAAMFETGGNRWRTFDAWPPYGAQPRTLFAQSGGKLTSQRPADSPGGRSGGSFEEFVSDPNRPVPYVETVSHSMTNEYMVDDQRFASRRPDVVVYQTDVLGEDLTIAGRLLADLWVSTTAADADWVVKLIDVFPANETSNPFTPAHQSLNSYQMLVRSEVIRGRFRNSYQKPEPFRPGEPAKVSLVLQDVLHRFKKGHRLMVQIQSTWFPLVDRNPQKWVDNIFFAKPQDFEKATHRVYHDASRATCLKFDVLPDPSSGQESPSDLLKTSPAKDHDWLRGERTGSAVSERVHREEVWKYVRPGDKGFVTECEIRRVTMSAERGASDRTVKGQEPPTVRTIRSVTDRGDTQLTLEAVFDSGRDFGGDRLQSAVVSVRAKQGTQFKTAAVRATVFGDNVTVHRDGQPPADFDCPPGTIVTSAPDWSDAIFSVERYDPSGQPTQEFPGVWMHPHDGPQRLTFRVMRTGQDEVTYDKRRVKLLRLQLTLRGGSTYVAWRNEAGQLVRLVPTKSAAGMMLSGWEQATRELRSPKPSDRK